MTKYVYKLDYNNDLFLGRIKKLVPTASATSTCTADCLITIDIEASAKDDLDEFMNSQGFVYLFETLQNLEANRNWGVMTSVVIAAIPSEDIDEGDVVYDSTLNKPLWWNGTAWKDALGN